MLPEEFFQVVYSSNLFRIAAYSEVIDVCKEMLRLQLFLARRRLLMAVRKVLQYVADTPLSNLIDTFNHETALRVCYERDNCP